MFYGIATFAQTKVLTTDGETLIASAIETNKWDIDLTINGETQNILKSNVFAVVPPGKKSFTYTIKKGKKWMLRKKDVRNNYQGTDRPRIYVYKYFGTKTDPEQIYVDNSESGVTLEEFTRIYKEQQQKIKMGNIAALGSCAIVVLIAII
jgi:hypothetical protein